MQNHEDTPELGQEDQLHQHLKGVLVHFGDGARVSNVFFPQHPPSKYGNKSHKAAGKVKMHTICCTWFNPSKIVYLVYLSRKWAETATKRFEKRFQGRKVPTHIQERDHPGLGQTWMVTLLNMPADTTDQQLGEVLTGVRPRLYEHGKRTSKMTEAAAKAFVEGLFVDDTQNGFGHSSLITSSTGAKSKLFMKLENPAHARHALSWSGRHYDELGSKIYVEQIATVKFRVLPEIYAVSKSHLDELQQPKAEAGANMSTFAPNQHDQLVVIHITGPQIRAVAKMKGRVESILAGTIILSDDNSHALWDEYFASIEGFAFLCSLSRPGKSFLYRDLRTRRLFLHGDDTLLNTTRLAVLSEICRRKQSVHTTLLEGELWSKVLRGGLKRLTERYGKGKVKLHLSSNQRTLIFSGSPEEFRRATELLENVDPETEPRTPSHSDTSNDNNEECPACLSDVEDAVELTCGHKYCRDCFETQCKEADGREVKIVCYGAEGNCGQSVDLDTLRTILSHEKFQALLSTSLECYVRSRPDQVTYCPTPDCPTIYRVTSDPGEIVCETCLALTCTKCGSVGHDGITCGLARDEAYKESKEYREFLKMKEMHNIKDCPKCTTPIQKWSGCNHMICGSCKTHLCWVCLQTFEDGMACYRHLTGVHGSIGDHLIPQELLDDGWV